MSTANEQEAPVDNAPYSHTAAIYGPDGRGGTGVFLELFDKRIAILTARHVVLPCILQGEITVAPTRKSCRSSEPNTVIIHGNRDASLLITSEEFREDAIPYPEWATTSPRRPLKGDTVTISGIVGEWRHPNRETKSIPRTTVLHFTTTVDEPDGSSGAIICAVNESTPGLPASFKGMSGGPCFDVDGKLIGINAGERRLVHTTSYSDFRVTPLSALDELLRSAVEIPAGTTRLEAELHFTVSGHGGTRRARAWVEYYWQVDNADGLHRGRISAIAFDGNATRYPLNFSSWFFWAGPPAMDNQIPAFYEELDSILVQMDFSRVR